MTWKTFMNAIAESGIENGSQAQILLKLFKRAGYINTKDDDISESTAKKWIDGTRNCKVSKYFPDKDYVNTEAIHSFFKCRPEDKSKRLQQIFFEIKDDSSPVDCETEDMDKFCWSLVNQFLDLLNFERIVIPDTVHQVGSSPDKGHQYANIPGSAFNREGRKCKSRDMEQPENILDVFQRSFQDFGIQEFLETDPIESVKSFRIEDAGCFVGRIKTNQTVDLRVKCNIEICEKIAMFTETLLEYIEYLKNNMKEEIKDKQPKYFFSGTFSEDIFMGKTDSYRQQLQSLYWEINAEVEQIRK